ncbi:DUF5988 family protein [Actinoplanes siamensis]|uniref:Uncharacterized protein n=1 Tax=Actinoplanes siamensis TaxID=1223317 RepID=A0A919NER0_9ACTN|nr:DUF5988 family protein [Actinoplanes siamensis]GIF09467.1 hypothetical protein Asi03nite_70050 [Actinoplanes siamensis]
MSIQEYPAKSKTVPGADAVEVSLEGGPTDIPRRFVVTAAELADGRIKVPYLAGYEHFERDPLAEGQPTPFAWTRRTKIAE